MENDRWVFYANVPKKAFEGLVGADGKNNKSY